MLSGILIYTLFSIIYYYVYLLLHQSKSIFFVMEVQLKHKSEWFFIYFIMNEYFMYFLNLMFCAAKSSLRAIHYLWIFKCMFIAINRLAINFLISAISNSAYCRRMTIMKAFITSVVWCKAAQRKRELL